MLKITMLITLIMILNIFGVSYGYWQDRFTSKITAQTGYIELSFEKEQEPKVTKKSEAFSGLRAELEDDDKTITVTGEIKDGEDGEFELGYSVFNHGSLPVEFDGIQIENLQMEGVTAGEPEGLDIKPGYSVSDSIVISIDTSEIDYSSADDFESEDVEGSTDIYKFEIVLTYKIGSWTEDLIISGEIEVVPSFAVTTLIVPMPAMPSVPVQGEIVTDGLLDGTEPDPIPEGPSDQELYGEGGTTAETDEPETIEGDSEPEPAGEGEEEVTNEESEEDGGDGAIQEDSEPASEDEEEEEGMDEQKQDDADGTDEGSDSGELSPDTGENN
jgi:hypothetical protein